MDLAGCLHMAITGTSWTPSPNKWSMSLAVVAFIPGAVGIVNYKSVHRVGDLMAHAAKL